MTAADKDQHSVDDSGSGSARYIVVVNVGSSSAKLGLFALTAGGGIDPDARLESNVELDSENEQGAHEAIATALQTMTNAAGLIARTSAIAAVGHRVVHGGDIYSESVVVNQEVEDNIAKLEEYAPVHNRLNLIGIQSAKCAFGEKIKQVAVFDTAFHRTIPEIASRYAVPYEWQDKYGIKRYGFHGISYAYAMERSAQLLKLETQAFNGIICHLGNGCSIVAIQNGKSIDTSMGFTPLEGLMMGARSGSIDPGIILQLLSNSKMTASDLSRLLNFESGLRGVSGITNDMRALLQQAAAGQQRAKLAIDMFVYHVQSFIGSYLAHLEQPQAVVFTGGIGENSADIRQRTIGPLVHLGFALDPRLNDSATKDADISAGSASIRTLVIKAREDIYIAREASRLL